MALVQNSTAKMRVKEHWEKETCGTRYGQDGERKAYFDEISAARYTLEPYIPVFADFPDARGKHVLEIGVGAGADFQNWVEHASHATGVDLTERAISLTAERLRLNSVPPTRYSLQVADAENLPFADGSFDMVYSWGVLHHSPDTERAFKEAFRVLKPGGVLRAMVYHSPSWTALMLYLHFALGRGQFRRPIREVVFEHLESPGTKVYSIEEAKQFLTRVGFSDLGLRSMLGPGDLLTIKPSEKYNSPFFKLIWRIYPRWLVRLAGDRYGLNLLISARKAHEGED